MPKSASAAFGLAVDSIYKRSNQAPLDEDGEKAAEATAKEQAGLALASLIAAAAGVALVEEADSDDA